MWWNKEKQYREESRDLIKKTYSLTARLDERSLSHGRELIEHEKDNVAKFKETSEKIEKYKCKHNKDVPMLIAHVDKQNGSISGLNESYKEISKRLTTLISETTGEEKAKIQLQKKQDREREIRDIKRNFIMALAVCTLTGIATVFGIFVWYEGKKEKNIEDLTKIVIELEKKEKVNETN
ncbi:MAG: hypothetical protein ACW980_25570 [Promethearchaeota archaeon]|jgi:seryl-tRNA synthetase